MSPRVYDPSTLASGRGARCFLKGVQLLLFFAPIALSARPPESAYGTGLAAQVDTLWSEDWDGDPDWTENWFVDNGTWEVGVPTSGPGAAYGGRNVAATVLAGNYSDTAPESRLVRYRSFVVPGSSENPRLRFWHWFDWGGGDYGRVDIRIEGGSTWEPLSPRYYAHSTGRWTYPLLDLSAYAGQEVEIAFFFHAQCNPFCDSNGPGWYIDDVAVVTGPPLMLRNPEDWELGIGDWYVDFGTWEVGVPASGPEECRSPPNCASTILDGSYSDTAPESRLISPYFIVPDSSEDPRLRFWHRFSFGGGDYGEVQVRVRGGAWTTESEPFYSNGSGVWTFFTTDSLLAYAGEEVQVAFFFHAQCNPFCDSNGDGWYVDDIEIEGLPPTATEPEAVPASFVLHGAYPNPFRSETSIRFSLREAAEVTLHVFDLLGREMRRVEAGFLAPGEQAVQVDVGGLPSGPYLYRLEARMTDRTETRSGRFTLIE